MGNSVKGQDREKLREKGQFWTPDWVADGMIAYVAQNKSLIFDPAAGRGAFYEALKRRGDGTKFYGTDIDESVIEEAFREGIYDSSSELDIRDFIKDPPKRKFAAIVANPPYIRHHKLSPEYKSIMRGIALRNMGFPIDGRAGIHIYFLIQALALLAKGGRLTFIMPADSCEGVFSKKLWSWITTSYSLEAVVAFDHKATPFPNIDTNAVVYFIENKNQSEKITWARCLKPNTHELFEFINSGFQSKGLSTLESHERPITEALETGLSREPRDDSKEDYYLLRDFAKVVRGVATGANDFFFLTRETAKTLDAPENFFRLAIGRTRDVEGSVITKKKLKELDERGRPTLLLNIRNTSEANLPNGIKTYLRSGESRGLNQKPLISTRRPWYKMEQRVTPPLLFAYLGRRNARFIKNQAGVVPLTSFLCVYPLSDDKVFIEKLWKILQDKSVLACLPRVAKSYGAGAIKIEPRSLENLPVPKKTAEKYDLAPPKEAKPQMKLPLL